MRVDDIRGLPGVVGVFRGERRREGKWIKGTECLCAHVRWKRPTAQLPAAERLPPEVDVIEVGLPMADEVENTDPVRGTRERTSTLTLIAEYRGYVFALMSGHGALPFADGKLMLEMLQESGDTVQVFDGSTSQNARVVRGALGGGGSVDWALIRFEPGTRASVIHSIAGPTPVKLRSEPITTDTVVRQYSSLHDRRTMFGLVKQTSASVLDMQLPDGRLTEYANLIVVSDNSYGRFSDPGDSGSLVVDEFGQAVGAVVGSSRQASLAYIYQFSNLTDALGEISDAFFSA